MTEEAAAATPDLSELNFDKKKKKKKTIKLDDEELASLDQRKKMDDEANDELFGVGPSDEPLLDKPKKKKSKKLNLGLDGEGDDAALADGMGELDLGGKKKKKNNVAFLDEVETTETEVTGGEDAEPKNEERPWCCRDLDQPGQGYKHEELLDRIYRIIETNNPSGLGGPQKLTMRPPSLARVGTKKICFTNFRETALALKRKEEHLMCFIFAELGTTGNQDAGGQLILKGKFNAKMMEKVLRTYIKDFVRCKTCNSPETTLNKRDRLYFLFCNKCQSERSVQAIKTGFQAVVGKRSRLRTAAAAAVPK